jgi:hypothetical protein
VRIRADERELPARGKHCQIIGGDRLPVEVQRDTAVGILQVEDK